MLKSSLREVQSAINSNLSRKDVLDKLRNVNIL